MDRQVEESVGRFDADRLLLGVRNGVLDLASRQLIAGTPELLVMRRMNVEFDANAKCAGFVTFMKAVTVEDKSLYLYIKKLLGYVLHAECNLHILPVLFGTGRNGKGVLADTMQWLFGGYATQVQANVLMDRKYASSGPTPELAQLPGVRFLNVTELERTRRIDHSLIKQICGGDTINCRALYGKPFVYRPMFTPFLVGNHRVQMDSDDFALWERVVVIPFDAHFGANKDIHLREKLKKEGAGILNWILNGYELFRNEGLKPPERVVQATKSYRYQSDSLMRWYEDRCKRDDESLLGAQDGYLNYQEWCKEREFLPNNNRLFKERLVRLGHEHVKRDAGHFFTNIRMNV